MVTDYIRLERFQASAAL